MGVSLFWGAKGGGDRHSSGGEGGGARGRHRNKGCTIKTQMGGGQWGAHDLNGVAWPPVPTIVTLLGGSQCRYYQALGSTRDRPRSGSTERVHPNPRSRLPVDAPSRFIFDSNLHSKPDSSAKLPTRYQSSTLDWSSRKATCAT